MSTPALYYNIEQSSQDVDTGNKTTTTSSGSDALSAIQDMISAAYTFVQAAGPTESRSMTVQLNAAVVGTPSVSK